MEMRYTYLGLKEVKMFIDGARVVSSFCSFCAKKGKSFAAKHVGSHIRARTRAISR